MNERAVPPGRPFLFVLSPRSRGEWSAPTIALCFAAQKRGNLWHRTFPPWEVNALSRVQRRINGSGVLRNHRQISPRCAILSPPLLLPILYGAHIQAEAAAERSTGEVHILADGFHVLVIGNGDLVRHQVFPFALGVGPGPRSAIPAAVGELAHSYRLSFQLALMASSTARMALRSLPVTSAFSFLA